MKEGYTRVTEILKPFSEIRKVDPLILEKAGVRGTRVHSICEAIVEGIGVYDVEPHLQGYINSFLDWWGEGKEVLEMEKRFYCDKHMISGQVDLILRDADGSIIICDLKTSAKHSKTWLLQGTAYQYLASLIGIESNRIQFVKLLKTGQSAKVFEYEPNHDLFFKTLEVYKYFNQ